MTTMTRVATAAAGGSDNPSMDYLQLEIEAERGQYQEEIDCEHRR
jgi:hypothetical protein